MSIRGRICLFAVALVLFISASAQAQPAGSNVAEMKFVTIPGLPTCAKGSVQNGDPGKGPSIILARIPAGCAIPWHWHMKLQPPPNVPGKTPWKKLDNAVRHIFTVSKEDVLKAESRVQQSRQKKQSKRKAVA